MYIPFDDLLTHIHISLFHQACKLLLIRFEKIPEEAGAEVKPNMR